MVCYTNHFGLFFSRLAIIVILCNNAAAMVPFPYFLALLALLVSLMGCTQKAPPGMVDESSITTSPNTSREADSDTSTQKPPANPDVVIKPAPLTTIFELSQPNGAHDWKVTVKGPAAKKLFKVMAISSDKVKHNDLKALKKSGKNIECYQLNTGLYQCEFSLNGANGELKVLNKGDLDGFFDEDNQLKNFCDKDPDHCLSKNLELYTAGGGKLLIEGESAQRIFEEMDAKDKDDLKKDEAKLIQLAADNTNGEGLRKRGIHADCYQQFLKVEPKKGIYTCTLWLLNSTIGEFDKIDVK